MLRNIAFAILVVGFCFCSVGNRAYAYNNLYNGSYGYTSALPRAIDYSSYGQDPCYLHQSDLLKSDWLGTDQSHDYGPVSYCTPGGHGIFGGGVPSYCHYFLPFPKDQIDSQFTAPFYRRIVGREASAQELQAAFDFLNAGFVQNGGIQKDGSVRSGSNNYSCGLLKSFVLNQNLNVLNTEHVTILGQGAATIIKNGPYGLGSAYGGTLLATGATLVDVHQLIADSPLAALAVNNLYNSILGRDAGPQDHTQADGRAYGQGIMHAGGRLMDVRQAIAGSNEAGDRVDDLYKIILNREATPSPYNPLNDGKHYGKGIMKEDGKSLADVLQALVSSGAAMDQQQRVISGVYTLLKVPFDQPKVDWWMDKISHGDSYYTLKNLVPHLCGANKSLPKKYPPDCKAFGAPKVVVPPGWPIDPRWVYCPASTRPVCP